MVGACGAVVVELSVDVSADDDCSYLADDGY